MSDHTPTTKEVREDYSQVGASSWSIGEQQADIARRTTEFNRWLSYVRAEAVEEAAQKIDFEWEVFTASDGYPSIRQHGKTPSELLLEFAKTIKEED